MNNYNITFSRRTSTAALVSVLFSVCAILFARLNKCICAAATVNGLQLIGINLIAGAVCMLLSISL